LPGLENALHREEGDPLAIDVEPAPREDVAVAGALGIEERERREADP
jgi:hypothetical protein